MIIALAKGAVDTIATIAPAHFNPFNFTFASEIEHPA
jgi:hypothetical protein